MKIREEEQALLIADVKEQSISLVRDVMPIILGLYVQAAIMWIATNIKIIVHNIFNPLQ